MSAFGERADISGAKADIAKRSGTITRYQRAGAVVTGDYAMDPPTPAEAARRERMKREG